MKTTTPSGKLIVLEGIDGCGKSTQVELLKRYLEEKGKPVVTGYEPTQGLWGKRIRKAAEVGNRLSPEEETECFLLDRLMHAEGFIRPALKEGKWVIEDRYYPSTMAYQGAAGIEIEKIRMKNEAVAPIPDAAIWLDVPVELALMRVEERGKRIDAFEKKAYLEKVRENYESFRMKWWHRIEAVGTEDEVQERIRQEMHLIFPEL